MSNGRVPSIEARMTDLVARIEELSRQHPDYEAFWLAVDAEMEGIHRDATTAEDQQTVEQRYHDVITEADIRGRLRPD